MGINIKKNDTVMVIAGKERGKIGRVFRVMPDAAKLLIEKLNLIKRHTRPTPANRDTARPCEPRGCQRPR